MASLEEKYIEYQKDAPINGALSFKEFENAMSTITKNEDVKEEIVDTSEELPETDEFAKMTDAENSAFLGEEVELGDAFKTTSIDSYQVTDRANKRLADLVPELKKENEALKIQLTNNLPDPEKEKLINIDTSSLSSFTSSVGKSFMNIAKEVPKRIDEVAADPKRRKNFIRGLQIINESSGIKPISQAKSPLGSIASGLLKAEASFTAEDIARLKAQKKEPRRYPSPGETLLTDTFKEYQKEMKIKKDGFKSVFDRYNLGKTAALKKNELPTGVLNSTFRDLKGILLELGLGDRYDALSKKFEGDDYTTMTLQDQTEFNDLFQAATFEGVVQDVKKLYPVSNKDIDTLLKTKGDISTRPEALRKLMAAQMAARDIALGGEDFAYKYFDLGDKQFEKKSIRMSEQMIGERLRKEGKVTDTTLETLFGTTKDITDAGYITAHYYQQLLAQKNDGDGDPFTIFVTAEKEKEKEIDDIIADNQKN